MVLLCMLRALLTHFDDAMRVPRACVCRPRNACTAVACPCFLRLVKGSVATQYGGGPRISDRVRACIRQGAQEKATVVCRGR